MSVYQEAKGSPILKGIIVLLSLALLYVLYEPYKIREEEERFRAESRARMINLRQAQLLHIGYRGRYNTSVDSLVQFIYTLHDTIRTSYFRPLVMSPFVPESLLHTPKSWKPYALQVVDTTAIMKYLLEDPDGYGSVGSLTDDARVNKASWEE
ncbi:MAG: hypothetical protein HBSIN02_01320 [Bacteroidia bacterium]|nr:MAG: hypothetical protein HBSIN02_01320 [Bacteroidia bacterium]